MNRPYSVVLVSASLDGRISLGPNRTMFDDMFDPRCDKSNIWKEIEDLVNFIHNTEANLLGSNSLVRKDEILRKLPKFTGSKLLLYEDYLPSEVINRPNHKGWLIVVDGQGRVRSGFKGSEDNKGWHILHIVSKSVDSDYLAFLRKEKIPYLISGEKKVDLKVAFNKMKTKLNVKHLVHSSGGKLAGAMLKEGLIDEINVIIQPRIIGGNNTPSLFSSSDLLNDEYPTSLELISTQVKSDGYIWLRYKVNNRKEE